jgi:hypothetical protein
MNLEISEDFWLYDGNIFYPEDYPGAVGFIYIITNITNGRKYIGRKKLTKSKITQRSGKQMKIRIESDWLNYYGSSKDLTKDVKSIGKDNFDREILHICYSDAEMTYLESKEIFIRDCLLDDNYYNKWVYCRCTSGSLEKSSLNICKNVQ